MSIKIYGAYRSSTTMDNFVATTGFVGETFQINSYSSLTFDGGQDPTRIEGDSFWNEIPNDPTQSLAGRAISWDYTMKVTDGVNTYEIGVLDYDLSGNGQFASWSGEQGYFLGFIGSVPPLGTTLEIVEIVDNGQWIPLDVFVPCFTSGTLISTPDGVCPVEDLAVGDALLTLDRGAQRINWIGQRRLTEAELAAHPDLRPVRIAAGALGDGLPARDLLVSPQHRMLLTSPIVERMFGAADILVAAKKLVGMPGISVATDVTEVSYFHILLDRHDVIFAEAAPTESLFTGAEALKAVGPAARAEILKLFPEIGQSGYAPVHARPVPQRGRRIQQLLDRHQKNGKALVGRNDMQLCRA